MHTPKTISLLGCGWLGIPLAKSLAKEFQVKGGTPHQEIFSQLQHHHITPYLLHTNTIEQADSSFFICDTLIITLPFKRTFEDPFDYKKQLQTILPYIHSNTRVIFTSSTSVYPNEAEIYTEDSHFIPKTERQQALLETEQLVLNEHSQSCVLRLAGLYGPGREIGSLLSKKRSIHHPDSRVNLVHLDDVIRVMTCIINNFKSGIYNVVSDTHPTRAELYTLEKCDPTAPKIGKIVSNHKLKNNFSFNFIHNESTS